MKTMELERAFSFWIDRTARMMKHFAATRAAELNLGVTIDQWVVLAMITQEKDISQTDLCERTFKDKASIARIADVMEKKGFIVRRRNPVNRREYMLRCTPSGQRRVRELLPYVERARTIGMKGLSTRELAGLITTLQKIYHNYEKAMATGQ